MKPLDPVTLLAAIAIAAFAIDRTVTALLFLLSYAWKSADPALVSADRRVQAERSYKLAYFVLACAFALVVYFYGKLSVFSVLGFPHNPVLDAFITMLVLVGGSDRISALLKIPDAGKAPKPPAEPIQITGTVTLVGDGAQLNATGKKNAAGV